MCAPSGFGSQIRSGLKLSFRFALDHDGRPVPAKARSWSIDRHRTPTHRQADAHPGSNLRGAAARVRALAHTLHEIGVDGLVHNAETAEKRFDEFARGDARQARR